jgi:bifunctional oligoribonuclease and PAP phosphatase NrnA
LTIGPDFSNIFYLYTLIKIEAKMMYLSKYTKELLKILSSSENLLLISHINPDGDTIGSQLAMYHFLKASGREAVMMSPNNFPEFLNWMDGIDQINIFIKDRIKCKNLIEKADAIVLLDFNQSHRLGEAEELVIKSKARKIIIDHHLDPGDFAELTISEPAKCATAELIHDLVCEMNGSPFMTKPYAEALYVGIVTDTGNFEHGNYSSDTLRIVADLLDTGIQRDKILNLIYNNFSSDRLRLQGFALNQRMVVLPELMSAYIFLTRDDMKEYNHLKGDTEGFVNMPLSIKGINFAALFIEKENFIKISFRSKGQFPTNEFATKYFAGGGHLNASGGEYYDTLQNTIDYFLKVLRENVWRFENHGL